VGLWIERRSRGYNLYGVEYSSLKSLWQALTSSGQEQRGERRRESRLPAHGLARIHWDVEGEGKRTEEVNLLGFSEHGCSFRTAEPLAIGQRILVEGAHGMFVAVVRHSAPDGHEYIIGTEVLSRDGQPLERTDSTPSAAAEVGPDRET
jgi:hypothetical protein